MTSLFPRVQFVDAPHAGATVVADLNAHLAADVRTLHDGFSLGSPTLAGDAGRRRRAWGKRRLQVPVHVRGQRSDALAAHRKLSQVATRDGWLCFQLDPYTPPVWFRTYATEPEPIDFGLMVGDSATDDVWRFTLPLDADPFGVGEEVTLGPYTVTNSPVSGGMRVGLPAIAGDMPAPARVEIVRNGGMIHGPAVAVSTTPPASSAVSSWAGVGGAVSSAAYIGGSYRPTSGPVSDWTMAAVFAPTGLPAGRWRFLMRLGGSSDVGAFAVRWLVYSATEGAWTEPVVVDVRNQTRWVDLGQGPWPLSDASALGVTHQSSVALWIRRLDAGGELHFDNQLMMVPVDNDTSLLGLNLLDVNTANTRVLVDAVDRRALAVTGAAAQPAPTVRGGWPALHPGRPNTLTIFQNLDPTPISGRSDAHATSSTVTVKYRPQYLWGVG